MSIQNYCVKLLLSDVNRDHDITHTTCTCKLWLSCILKLDRISILHTFQVDIIVYGFLNIVISIFPTDSQTFCKISTDLSKYL